MGTTVENLKVGSRLMLGSYGCISSQPEPVLWLKATKGCDFISQFTLDHLVFDARERNNPETSFNVVGNPDYEKSNLLQFLNSSEEGNCWFHPAHSYDTPPSGYLVRYSGEYESHAGFLRYFESFELDAILPVNITGKDHIFTAKIRLPSSLDLYGRRMFPLFKKSGKRAEPSDDCRRFYNINHKFDTFWLCDEEEAVAYRYQMCSIYGRDGSVKKDYPFNSSGIRPVCTLNPKTKVEQDESTGIFYLSIAREQMFNDSDLASLLGISL